MRDLAFVAFLLALFAGGFRRPFLFVLAYVYIDIVSPQRLTYYLLNSVPVSLIAVALTVAGWAMVDDKTDVKVAPRQGLLLLLLAYCCYTTFNADFPGPALDKWDWVWKTLAFAFFLPFTLRTRLRIEALLLFMILSAASIVIVGGIKTLASGGGYGSLNLMVADNAGLYEGSTISTVAVAIVPLILWLAKYGTVFRPDWKVKGFAYALVFACLLIPIGTSTRTGLLCIGLLAVLMLRNTKRRILYLGMLGAIGLIAVPLLPASFTDRMKTIETYQGDSSASTRIAVWKWTIDYAGDHPMGGGFEAYRQNKIQYDKVNVEGANTNNATVETTVETDASRAYHSAYFEMLGEQGYPGLAIWLLIQLIGLFRMEVLRRRYSKPEGGAEWAAPLAGSLQIAHCVYLLGAAFIGIAFQPFVFMLIGAQIGLDSYLARKRAAGSWQPIKRRARVATAAEPMAPEPA